MRKVVLPAFRKPPVEYSLEEALDAIRGACPGAQVGQGSPKGGKPTPSSATVFSLGVERMLKV